MAWSISPSNQKPPRPTALSYLPESADPRRPTVGSEGEGQEVFPSFPKGFQQLVAWLNHHIVAVHVEVTGTSCARSYASKRPERYAASRCKRLGYPCQRINT